MYPKHINLREELIKRGIKPPPKLKLKKPNEPKKKNFRKIERYERAMEVYQEKLEAYKEKKEHNRRLWDEFKSIVYKLIHDDIKYSKDRNIKAIKLVIKKKYKNNPEKPFISIIIRVK